MKRSAYSRLGTACVAAALAAVIWGATAVAAASAPAQRAVPVYHAIAVVKPARGETVFDNAGDMDIKVALAPGLDAAAGDRIALILDGRTASVQNAASFRLSGVARGEHSLEARVLDSDGNVLIASGQVKFEMWQASRLFPNRHGN